MPEPSTIKESMRRVYGSINTSGASVHVYDAGGVELFDFNRAGRWTDKGATNSAAKEIIKRILQLRKLKAAEKK